MMQAPPKPNQMVALWLTSPHYYGGKPFWIKAMYLQRYELELTADDEFAAPDFHPETGDEYAPEGWYELSYFNDGDELRFTLIDGDPRYWEVIKEPVY